MSDKTGGPVLGEPYPTTEEIMGGVSFARMERLANQGITVRDFFAAAALPGLVGRVAAADVAALAFLCADDMLRERAK